MSVRMCVICDVYVIILIVHNWYSIINRIQLVCVYLMVVDNW